MKVSSPGAPLRGSPVADAPAVAEAPARGPSAQDVAPPPSATVARPLPIRAPVGTRAATPAEVAAVAPRRPRVG